MIESFLTDGHISKRFGELSKLFNAYINELDNDSKDEVYADKVFVELSVNQAINLMELIIENCSLNDYEKEAEQDIEQTVHRFLDAIEGYLESH